MKAFVEYTKSAAANKITTKYKGQCHALITEEEENKSDNL